MPHACVQGAVQLMEAALLVALAPLDIAAGSRCCAGPVAGGVCTQAHGEHGRCGKRKWAYPLVRQAVRACMQPTAPPL
jgi:hypothetical protein